MEYNKERPLRVFEAFSGYGSQSLAFKYLKDIHPDFEFEVVGISDIEENAVKAYHLIHGDAIKNYGDVTKIDWNEVPDFDFKLELSLHRLQHGWLAQGRRGRLRHKVKPDIRREANA